MTSMPTTDTVVVDRIDWVAGSVTLTFAVGGGPVRLVDVQIDGVPRAAPDRDHWPTQSLVEIDTARYGRAGNPARMDKTVIGAALRYRGHTGSEPDGIARLVITQQDPVTGLVVDSVFEVVAGTPAVRTRTVVGMDAGASPITLWSVSSFATGAAVSDRPDVDVWFARSGWCAENRWERTPLRSDGLLAIDPLAHGETCEGRIAATSLSTWSSATFNPIGAATTRSTGVTLAWQVEHNGGWHWEVGEHPEGRGIVPVADRVLSPEPAGRQIGDRSFDGAYVLATGPNDTQHAWCLTLRPGDSFESVPVTFTVGRTRDDAFGNLARYRRAARRPHPQDGALPVVFNDYMNTLEGDPTEAKLLRLIDAAAAVGADCFCIDAGWYDDTAGWWASVGDWQPSTVRFPRGLGAVIDHIRSAGLTPGLWMEPEVVGVTSRAARELPDDAFLTRGGERIRNRERYFLDLRNPAARAHLDSAVDRVVDEFGLGFLKFDYNITPGPGTDRGGTSVGAGLLELNRAQIGWLGGVVDRHPEVIIENCASGGMRSDFAMLATLPLQSTSDQTDPLLYPAIAVGALAHILPEQAGNWAYPQPEMDDEAIAFAMTAGLAGRLYLAGVLNRMDDEQLALVRAAIDVHRSTKSIVARSIPRFPLGLPSWADPWVAVALDAGETDAQTLLVVWHLPTAGAEIAVPLPNLGSAEGIETLYPPPGTGVDWAVELRADGVRLTVPVGVASARMFRIRHADVGPAEAE